MYELVASQRLFRYQRNTKFGLDETENMLYQMMMHAGAFFSAEQLQASPKAPEYFNADCNHLLLCSTLVNAHLYSSGLLKKNPTPINWPIKARFDAIKMEMCDEDATATASLIGRCLQLDPADRPMSAELLNDDWFDGVE